MKKWTRGSSRWDPERIATANVTRETWKCAKNVRDIASDQGLDAVVLDENNVAVSGFGKRPLEAAAIFIRAFKRGKVAHVRAGMAFIEI